MTIYIGADHAGFELKGELIRHLQSSGHRMVDVGAANLEAHDDYPKYAFMLATKILGEPDSDGAHGILICGSGQGMSIAANRIRGIRAGLAWDKVSAKSAREDDDANVLVLPARHLVPVDAVAMVDDWLTATFKADPQYKRRLDEIEQLYG